MRVSFSRDSSKWYSSTGAVLGWNTLTSGTNTIDLSGRAWSWSSFYYKIEFTSDGSATPVVDSVSLAFTPVTITYVAYETGGTLTSLNMLSGESVSAITGFSYTASAIPADTALKARFSRDSSSWYSAGGVMDAWTTLAAGSNEVSLASLGWTGANLYYQAAFTSDGTGTAVLDSVSFAWTYTPATPGTPDLVSASDSGSGSTDNLTNDTTPTFMVSCETAATVKLFSGSVLLGTGSCVASSASVTSSALVGGTYAIRAVQTVDGSPSATGSALTITLDTTAPTVQTLSPADNATDVAIDANLVLTFSEVISKIGTGTVTLYRSSDDTIIETITVTGALVTGSGTAVITINPSTTLGNSVGYYVRVSANAFPDGAGNSFAGIADNTTWNFTTVAAASSSSSSSSSSETSGGGSRGGGGSAGMRGRIAAARDRIIALFEGSRGRDAPLAAASEQGTSASFESPPGASFPPLRPSLATIAERRGLLLAVVDGREVLYRDVPVDTWYAPYVASLIDGGIAEGYRDDVGEFMGEFGVRNPVTFAETIKMALKATGGASEVLPPPRNTSARGTWSASYIAEAEARNFPVLTGDLDVNTPATRAEVVVMLLSALDLPVAPGQLPSFPDVPADSPYAGAIATAAFYGVVEGNPDGTFRPNAPINRAEVSKLISLLKGVR